LIFFSSVFWEGREGLHCTAPVHTCCVKYLNETKRETLVFVMGFVMGPLVNFAYWAQIVR
jgi:hypothetical protein